MMWIVRVLRTICLPARVMEKDIITVGITNELELIVQVCVVISPASQSQSRGLVKGSFVSV